MVTPNRGLLREIDSQDGTRGTRVIDFQVATAENRDLIRAVMTHPDVYPAISDDFCPDAALFQPVDHPSFLYVFAFCGAQLLGLWLFVPQNGVCWEVHTCLLPGHGYRRGREAAKLLAQWVWAHTNCRRIVTNVPSFNRQARLFAQAAGMKPYGVNPNSYLKHGQLHDQIMLGLSRPEEGKKLCQQQ